MNLFSPKKLNFISKLLLGAIALALIYNHVFSVEKIGFDQSMQIVALCVAFLAIDELVALRKAVESSKRAST